MTNVTLMVLPGTGAEAPPKLLLEDNGVWRDMGYSAFTAPLAEVRAAINKVLKDLMDILEQGLPNPGWVPLKEIWEDQLYLPLLPERLRTSLEQNAGSADDPDVPILRIHTDSTLEWIPWEILYDGKDFLGLRYQIARLPIVPTGPDLSNQQPRAVSRIYHLLGQHVFDTTLPIEAQLFNDWQTTFAGVNARENRFPPANGAGGGWPTQTEVLKATDADILHFTCHGGFQNNPAGAAFWTLNHTQIPRPWFNINASFVRTLKLMTNKPLVFGNACSSAAGAALITGFGPEFFARGAIDFIGTFAPVRKNLAINFACYFYQRLLGDKMPIGKALWETKKYYRHQADPSWLFYCLYGPPETRFNLV